jgi:hypothetical protein
MTRIISTVSVLGVAVLASIATGSAQSRIEAGVLECRGGGGASFVVGSVHQLGCLFRPSVGPPQNYAGTVRRVGLDLGVTERMALAWIVLAPSREIGPSELAGVYGGVSASAAVGVGVGANVLVGGSNSSVALQPLSIEGQTGLNLAAGVTSFELRAQ